MLVKEFSGKSEKEAIAKALEALNLTEDQIRVEVIDKGKRNLFGIGEEIPTVIRVYYEEISTNLSELQNIISTILKHMGLEATVSVKEESEKRIYVNITSNDSGVLIGKKGATLESLQFLIYLIALKNFSEEEAERYIILDVDGYRERREETLRNIARQSAIQAKRTRRKILLDPMSPYERRIIHLELQSDQDVETKSEGESPYRCVAVFTKKKNYNSSYNKNKKYNNDRNNYNSY